VPALSGDRHLAAKYNKFKMYIVGDKVLAARQTILQLFWGYAPFSGGRELRHVNSKRATPLDLA